MKGRARTVRSRQRAREESNATHATPEGIERARRAARRITRLSSDTVNVTPPKSESGNVPDDGAEGTPPEESGTPESGNSRTSSRPSSASIGRWRQPSNAKAFAAQANAVATAILNGTIELDKARLYSSVARTVAQALSTEVSRARFLSTTPDLDLSDEVFTED